LWVAPTDGACLPPDAQADPWPAVYDGAPDHVKSAVKRQSRHWRDADGCGSGKPLTSATVTGHEHDWNIVEALDPPSQRMRLREPLQGGEAKEDLAAAGEPARRWRLALTDHRV
jgi:hypothetical protein